MDAEVIVCDIGNTSLKIGFADSRAILFVFALPSKSEETEDSLGLRLLEASRFAGINPERIEACVAASVVPTKNRTLSKAIRRYIGCPCYFAPDDIPIPFRNDYARPSEVGADRLVGAWAARKLFGDRESLIVIDYGTAATFDCVVGSSYKGGLIFPGLGIAAKAMTSAAAKLPPVDLDIAADKPEIGRDTATSIRHGLLFGYAALTEGIISLLAKDLPSRPSVVLTGGMADTLNRLLSVEREVVPNLILDGLRFLYRESPPG